MHLCVINLQILFCKTTDEPKTSANTPNHKTPSDLKPESFSLLCPKLCRNLQSISSVNEFLNCEVGDSQLKNTSTTSSQRVTPSYILRWRLIQPLTSHRTKSNQIKFDLCVSTSSRAISIICLGKSSFSNFPF